MDSELKISVIVPCYKVEKYLDQCVSSIVSQTYENIEIILVDDGSPDGVPELCDEWAKKDERIKVVHKQNEGLGYACNSGLAMATGDYCAFCDSDDYLDKTMYEDMLSLAVDKGCDMVLSGLKRVDDEGNSLGLLPHTPETKFVEGTQDVRNFALDMIASEPRCRHDHNIQVSAKVVLYNKSIIDEYGVKFVSERQYPSEDMLFNVEYISHCRKICIMHRFYYNYRVNTQSLSHVVQLDKFPKFVSLYNYAIDVFSNLKLDGSHVRVQRMFIGYTRSYIKQIIKSRLPIKRKKEVVMAIMNDGVWNDILESYPVNDMRFAHKVFMFAISKKSFIGVFLLFKLR